MKKLALLSLSLLCSYGVQAAAIDEVLKVEPEGRVEIKNLPGELVIKGWERAEVAIKGELDDRIDNLIFEVKGKVTNIKVDKQYRKRYEKLQGELIVMLPLGSAVEVASVNTDLTVSGLVNQLKVELVNGDVNASMLSGKTELSTVNGDIKVFNLSGEAELETINGEVKAQEADMDISSYRSVNGDIELEANAGRLTIETINGDVALKALAIEDLTLNTVNGEIEAELGFVGQRPSVTAASVSGDIALILDKNISANIAMEAHVGGDIDNQLSAQQPEKNFMGLSDSLAFQLGDGEVKIDMATVSGELTLKGK